VLPARSTGESTVNCVVYVKSMSFAS